MTSAFDGLTYEEGDPFVIVTQRPGMRVGRSRVGTARVGSGAVQEGEALSVSSSVPIEAAADTIGALRLSTYYKGLEGFIYPNVPKGKGRLALYFADFEGAGPGENVFDIAGNGAVLATGVDPYALAGANGEYVFKVDDIDIPGGPFEVKLTATAGHTFLNDATLLTANAVPPLPVVPTSHLNFGIGAFNARSATSDFEALILHKATPNSLYIDEHGLPELREIFEDPGRDLLGWLREDPSHNFVTIGWRTLTDEPGQFESTTPDSYGMEMATYLQNLGVAGQCIFKPNYEMNADWFEAGRNQPGNLHGARQVAQMRRIIPKMRAIAPALRFEWCPVLGYAPGDGSLPEEFYWGDDMVDIVSGDLYDKEVSGTPAQRWQGILAQDRGLVWLTSFAAAHGKPCSLGEWALWNTHDSRSGGGDNPYFVTHLIQWAIDYKFFYINWLNNSESDMNLGDNPASEAAFRAIAATVPAL